MRKNQDSPLPEEQMTEAILDAAKSITAATGILVNAASVAQKELVAKGRASQVQSVYRRDPAWARGLISAAQSVAGSVSVLVTSANSTVQGNSEPEALVAAAKGVAAATARLVYASRAKADPFSPSQQNLSAAARSVAAATQTLVDAASISIEQIEEEKPNWEGTNNVSAVKIEMEQQVKILKLQKELEIAQNQMGAIRKAQYVDSVAPQAKVEFNNQPQPRRSLPSFGELPTKGTSPPTKTPVRQASNGGAPSSPPTKAPIPLKHSVNAAPLPPPLVKSTSKLPVKATPTPTGQ